MESFENENEMMDYAKKFMAERLGFFEKDIKHCLKYPYAEFPAISYCFSIIDLLGSLYCGNARPGNTASNSKKYMKKMMKYTEDQCTYLQQIFRHKIVHLSFPKTVYAHNKKMITYHYRDSYPEKHLKLELLPPKGVMQPTSKIKHDITHRFWLGIEQLFEDIIQSVQGPNGYISQLKIKPELKCNFDKAISEIFSPLK